MTKPEGPYFGRDYLGFLKELERNNNREWFNGNKRRFEDDVQASSVRFVSDAAVQLRKISPTVVAVPKPFGGSVMRIYRDTRFSKDKRPYNTHVGIHFWHADSGNGKQSYPGYFLHVEPGETRVYAGVWRPEGAALKGVRDRIATRPAEWKKAVNPVEFMIGEALKRPPPGYDASHPLIEDIKRKDFVGGIRFSDRQVSSAAFISDFVGACRSLAPFNAFLGKAIGARW
ncbi:MAG TPA: DUF2461 domain-containing protein [Candidatus Thermoplasmatota archaeon]